MDVTYTTRRNCIQCYAMLPGDVGGYFCSARCSMQARRLGSPDVPLPYGTAYAYKRHMLRTHRAEMHIMTDVLVEHHLDEVLDTRIVEETGYYGHWLGDHPQLDEDSDEPDPIIALRREVRGLQDEAADRQAFIAAAQSVVSGQQSAEVFETLRTDLDRARMALEDVRR